MVATFRVQFSEHPLVKSLLCILSFGVFVYVLLILVKILLRHLTSIEGLHALITSDAKLFLGTLGQGKCFQKFLKGVFEF